jgi:type II secretory pathway pseudopilin PulG
MTRARSGLGFTVAEILIVLAVLGIVGIFAISKILASQQDQQKKAIFKETIAAVRGILEDGLQDGTLPTQTSSYFAQRINAVKICSSNSDTQGCWNTSSQGGSYEPGEPGFVLANGMTAKGFNDKTQGTTDNGVIFDYNGTTGPNTIGQDQLYLKLCYIDGCGGNLAGTGESGAGTLGPKNDGLSGSVSAANLALWESIFQ